MIQGWFTGAVFLDWLTTARALIRGRQAFQLFQSDWSRGVGIRQEGRPTRGLAFRCPLQAWWRRLTHFGGCEAISLRRLYCGKETPLKVSSRCLCTFLVVGGLQSDCSVLTGAGRAVVVLHFGDFALECGRLRTWPDFGAKFRRRDTEAVYYLQVHTVF